MSDQPNRPEPEQQPPVKRVGRCGLSSEGLTIAGYHFSWLIILLAIVVIILIFKRDTFTAFFTDARPVVAAPAYGVSAPVAPGPNFTVQKPGPVAGEMARLFGHSW